MSDIIIYLFDFGYDFWNNLIRIAITLFTTSPQSASGSVYTVANSAYNSISDISLPIATVFFLIAIIKDVIATPPDQQLRRFFQDAIKFVVMIGILANLWDIMGDIMNIADAVTSNVSGSSTSQITISDDLKNCIVTIADDPPKFDIWNMSDSVKNLLLYGFEIIIFMLIGVGNIIVCIAGGITILSCSFQRILKPLVIMPFSAITMAMAAGSQEGPRIAYSYLRTFFGFCISGAFMVIAVNLGSALASGGLIVFDVSSLSDFQKILYLGVQNLVTPIVIAGLVKGVDSIIQRFF